MEETNKQLTDRLKNGDESAFEIIYKKFVSRLYYFVLEYIPHKDLAENIVQETFMVLWNKRCELLPDSNLNAYLYTVARNNCLYKLRDNRVRHRYFSQSEAAIQELELNCSALEMLDTSQLIFNEIEVIINQTLSQLPPQCRTVFQLSRFEEKKNSEIASELQISVKAVEGHITKALKIFRVALKDYAPLVAFLFVR